MRRKDFTVRPKCRLCPSPAMKGHPRKDGTHSYLPYCHHCYCKDRPHRIHKKDHCELCGFKALHRCQLDVDHKDGNRKNNDPLNLQTLCRNCHSYKTQVQEDYLRDPYAKNIQGNSSAT